ncbi:hypothetical protein [Pelosinus sp. IPA-1]|uniref:YobI family P-loop NTPase n=1 Tax=Pelosinus sp. IPA-1 TaxID=3029569 RepID=UPI00243628CD|nr:hypothetical protein [Pelosinus sp. IPA-1]GMB02055.1 putative membrane protein YobI [Pelosinus sp. IPA-1]
MKTIIKDKCHKLINLVIELLERLKTYLKKETENIYGYEDLAPDENVDVDGRYGASLDWAIGNEKIKNIALTGTYGSGKSSVLRTYQSRNKRYKFLDISLANFKENVNDENAEIERNILLQMFYQVESKTIPYMRLNRITNLNVKKVLLKFLFSVSLLIVGLVIFNPQKIIDIKSNMLILENLNIGSNTVFIICVIFIVLFYCNLLWVIKFLKENFKINKIKVDKTEIEINKESDSSIFNKHIDEIMYFFEVTKYDVVVFEDLDRFENINTIHLFTKLREINTLLNNSEQINRKIVFIYALKDDMFSDNAKRTKFFDFIIPVIPVINSSNSCEILHDMFERHKFNISKKFISDITVYINDMRTLKNIYNEFIIYQAKLSEINLNMENLLAMIIYKNVYPEDFAKLQVNEGFVYEVFQNKHKIADTKMDEINKCCLQIEKNIELAKKEHLENVDELQAVYYDCFLYKYSNHGYITIGTQQFQISNLNKVSILDAVKGGNKVQNQYDYLTADNKKANYFDREAVLLLGKDRRIEELQIELDILKRKKDEIKLLPLKKIITEENIGEGFSIDFNNKKLLKFLIKRGYIDEMYHSYITYFYPGSLTKEDMDFLASIKNQEALTFDYKLTKYEEIINKMYIYEFEQQEILNYNLIDFMIENIEKYRIFVEIVLTQLVNESDKSISFIDGYLKESRQESAFIKLLCKRWNNLWRFIDIKSNFPIQKKNEYLTKIIKFADVDDIHNLNSETLLTQYISKATNFLKLIIDEQYIEKIQLVLERLEVKFEYLETPYNGMRLFDFVYENNMYKINQEMIELIINIKGKVPADKIAELKTSNYTVIKESNCDYLIKYIDDNIQEYLENVFLKLENNNNETEENILNLLNKESLDKALQVAILDKEVKVITDITEVKNKELWNILVQSFKVSAEWFNVINYYKEINKIDDVLVMFFNRNYIELSKNELNKYDGIEDALYKKISMDIMRCEQIEESCFEKIKESIPYQFDKFSVEDLSENRISSIINEGLLSLTIENFNSLKDNSQNKHILLLERKIDEYLGKDTEYELDSNDIEMLLDSEVITSEQKKSIIQDMNEGLISDDNSLAEKIYIVSLDHEFNEMTQEIFEKLIMSDLLSSDKKLNIITKVIEYLPKEAIMGSFANIEAPYCEIANSGKRPLLLDNSINQALVIQLETKGYISSWKKEGGKLRVINKMA